MTADEWDEASPNGVSYKSIDMRFIATMRGGVCEEEHIDGWGRRQICVRLPDHSGRHLSLCVAGYPTAVWR